MWIYDILTNLGTTDILIAAFVFIVSYLLIGYYGRWKRNLPPGPVGLPIVGCLSYMKKDPHLKLLELATKYGDVFSLYLGSRFVVVLNGVDAVKEGLNKSEFLARPPHSPFDFGFDIPSLGLISGKGFHDQRKFMLRSMRDLGFGKTVMEECMKVELEYFLKALEDTKGQPYDVSTVLSPSMSNNITALIFGTRYDFGDPRRKHLEEIREITLKFIGETVVHAFLLWIPKIPFVKTYFGYDRIAKVFSEDIEFNKKRIEEHRRTLDPNNPRDYIDKFLLEIQEHKEKKITDSSFTEEMLIGNIGAIMGGGSETVHTTLSWCLLLVAVHREIQKKIQDEISTVIGSERMPAYVDQRQMPYTQSVIMEIMRWRTIIPLDLFRYTFEDTTFYGYDIPKDTIILANLWSAHYDTRYWKKPEKFTPERFLSEDGQSVVKPESFMPFSTGRRSCPGETMAVVEIFLYFTTILQSFDISLPKGVVPDFEGVLSVSLSPKPHKLCFVSRSPK